MGLNESKIINWCIYNTSIESLSQSISSENGTASFLILVHHGSLLGCSSVGTLLLVITGLSSHLLDSRCWGGCHDSCGGSGSGASRNEDNSLITSWSSSGNLGLELGTTELSHNGGAVFLFLSADNQALVVALENESTTLVEPNLNVGRVSERTSNRSDSGLAVESALETRLELLVHGVFERELE